MCCGYERFIPMHDPNQWEIHLSQGRMAVSKLSCDTCAFNQKKIKVIYNAQALCFLIY